MNGTKRMTELLDAKAAAQVLGLALQTLAILRVAGGGPTYVKLGRRVLYDPDDLREWIDASKRGSTSEALEASRASHD